jgi:Ca2+-transporting ATPase
MSEKPFNSEQKYMAVSGIHTDSTYSSSSDNLRPPLNGTINANSREMYYIKGSIDIILDRCQFYYVNEESTPGLDEETRKAIMMKAQSTASRGLRVIAMAYGYGNVDSFRDSSRSPSRTPSPGRGGEKDHLVFVGFAAMVDPPRKGVADSIGLLQAGGVHVVMITGDAEHTALAIAKDIGFRVGRQLSPLEGNGQRYSGVLTGKAIDQLTKAQLKEIVGGISVFARTTPKHKMRIVEAFQSRGAVVAMTGDGVNDAPALKMADIGLSMGKSGTDVAKEAADAILVDDNFSTILPAVEEGELVFFF